MLVKCKNLHSLHWIENSTNSLFCSGVPILAWVFVLHHVTHRWERYVIANLLTLPFTRKGLHCVIIVYDSWLSAPAVSQKSQQWKKTNIEENALLCTRHRVFRSVKSLTGVVMLKVPTVLHHRGSSVLEISSWLHPMHDQPRRLLSHQTHTEPEGWASYTSEGTQCLWIHCAFYQFTLQDKDAERWDCQRNLMWCLKNTPSHSPTKREDAACWSLPHALRSTLISPFSEFWQYLLLLSVT